MRKRMALLVSALLGLAGIVAAVALAGHSASPMELSAKLNSRQEVPNPRGEPVRAGGAFSAKLTGTNADVEAHVLASQRRRGRGAHPLGREAQERPGDRAALRPVQVDLGRLGEGQRGGGEGPPGQGHLRQRAHREEPERRDPRPDRDVTAPRGLRDNRLAARAWPLATPDERAFRPSVHATRGPRCAVLGSGSGVSGLVRSVRRSGGRGRRRRRFRCGRCCRRRCWPWG